MSQNGKHLTFKLEKEFTKFKSISTCVRLQFNIMNIISNKEIDTKYL